jgi:hypothetical protein
MLLNANSTEEVVEEGNCDKNEVRYCWSDFAIPETHWSGRKKPEY